MKTLLIVDDKPAGITEEDIKENDIIHLGDKNKIFVVGLVQAMPHLDRNHPLVSIEAEQIAYAFEKVNKNNKKVSQKLEKNLAKKLGGRATPGSGAFDFHKGDVKTKDFLLEHKFTNASFYRLNVQTWLKIKNEAFSQKRLPAMEIVFDQSNIPFNLLIMDILDFGGKFDLDESQIAEKFYSLPIITKNKTIMLKKQELDEHYSFVIYNIEKIPSYLIELNNNLLIGFKTSDFERMNK